VKTILSNGQIFDGDVLHHDKALLLDGKRVAGLMPLTEMPSDCSVVDLGGDILTSGFVDIQVNGGGGVLFNETPDAKALKTASAAHRRYGTTSLLPTIISDEFAVMEACADAVRNSMIDPNSSVVGIHFEGPILNPARAGAHQPEKIKPFDREILDILSRAQLDHIVLTVAPEILPVGAIRELVATGARVCAGHTEASAAQIKNALSEGLVGFTHLFNAMAKLESRVPGVVGAALDDPDSWCGIIADGFHVDPVMMRIAARAKKIGKIVLVTDAMPTVGTTETEFYLQGEKISVDGGRCVTAAGVLAGSNLNMALAVRNAVEMIELPLEEALRMASLYPAEFLEMDNEIGRIKAGHRANLVTLNNDFNVTRSWQNGQLETYIS
jgi:N-acetylglucosamine-6-phosphate deacetylase